MLWLCFYVFKTLPFLYWEKENRSTDIIHHLPSSTDKIFSPASMFCFCNRGIHSCQYQSAPASALQRDFYKPLMQRQFHFFESFINALAAVPVGKVPVGSYFGKSFRQYVLFKTADKFTACKRHLFLFTIIGIIFIIKSYRIVLIIDTDYLLTPPRRLLR